tara:strand:- start:307 stop:435 length:129 start_codon:yes stop_codon:yes gene_type:complete
MRITAKREIECLSHFSSLLGEVKAPYPDNNDRNHDGDGDRSQ